MHRFLLIMIGCVSSSVGFCQENPRLKHQPNMSYLANEHIKIGVDLQIGGAITYLSLASKEENIVNSWDWGRQIQMSHYAGPVPFVVGNQKPADHWKHLGWNPVQAGDDFRNPSKVLSSKNDGKELYVKCSPMQWPLSNVPAECTFETWITLDRSTVQVRSKVKMNRSDRTFYAARMQELPAIYLNSPYHRVFTPQGSELKQIKYTPKKDFPWTSWFTSECWAALVNDVDFGLGVYHPGCHFFSGGIAGKPGPGNAFSQSTGYLAPNFLEHLDHDGEFEFRYVLALGTLKQIRAEFQSLHPKQHRYDWSFAQDRQHWSANNATDQGWPLKREWVVNLTQNDPQLISPAMWVNTQDVRVLKIVAALQNASGEAQLFWSTLEKPGFHPSRSVNFKLKSDGEMREYEVTLQGLKEFEGTLTGLRIDPSPGNAKEGSIRIQSIRLEK